MKGQGCIIGAGALEYPAEFQGSSREDARRTSRIGKTITLTSHLRPPRHPGRRLGRVPEEGARAASSASATSTRTSSPRCASRTSPIHWAPDISVDLAERHRQDRPRAGAHQRVPRARPPHGRHRPARVRAALAPRPRHREPRPHLLGPRPRVRHRRLRRQAHGAAARHPRRAARLLLPHDRHRVHAHPGPGAAPWIQDEVERKYEKPTHDEQMRILGKLNEAEAFETFLQTKYVGQKRFSLEGGESVIALLDEILQGAAEDGLDEVAIGMAHRGRLNVLTNIAGKTYGQIFREFEGTAGPEDRSGLGRREVPPRHRGHLHGRRRPPDPRLPRREPVAPRGRRRRARGHRARQAGPQADRHLLDAADPHPRRRGDGRPGHRRRDAADVAAARLPHRRHHPRRTSTTRSASPPCPATRARRSTRRMSRRPSRRRSST